MERVDELREVLRLAGEYGARRVKVGDIEVEMLAVPVAQPPLREAIGAAAGRPTEDEMLMWSAPQQVPSEGDEK